MMWKEVAVFQPNFGTRKNWTEASSGMEPGPRKKKCLDNDEHDAFVSHGLI